LIVRVFASESLIAQIAAGSIAIPFCALGQIFAHVKKIPERSRSILVRQGVIISSMLTMALLITTGLLIANAQKHSQGSRAEQQIANLSVEIGRLRASYQTILQSPPRALEVNRDARRL